MSSWSGLIHIRNNGSDNGEEISPEFIPYVFTAFGNRTPPNERHSALASAYRL